MLFAYILNRFAGTFSMTAYYNHVNFLNYLICWAGYPFDTELNLKLQIFSTKNVFCEKRLVIQ